MKQRIHMKKVVEKRRSSRDEQGYRVFQLIVDGAIEQFRNYVDLGVRRDTLILDQGYEYSKA
jgi:hypothetical protein